MRLKSSVTKKITAVIIVLAMNLVGSLLISALVVFPALSAMRLCRSFRGVTVCSAVFAVCCAFSGIIEDATSSSLPFPALTACSGISARSR